LASQKECKILEGHLMADHVHILISIPPKYSVSQVVEKCDIDSTNLCRAKKELHWSEILGKEVLCFNSR